jgi:hypothetical protein
MPGALRPPDGQQGRDLRRFLVDEPTPEPAFLGHLSNLLSRVLKVGRSAVQPRPGPCAPLGVQIGSYEEGASPSSLFSSSVGVIRARYTCSVVISAAQLAASNA